jgi:VCBS repeat-containing protein
VGTAPDAVNDSKSVNEDGTLNVAAPGVLDNDTDVDGDNLTVTNNTSPAHGSVTVNANGSFTYTPNANYNGPDSFTYTISDGNGGTDTATVSITVTAVNDAPAISATTGPTTVNENKDQANGNKTYSVNATDVDGDTLSYKWTVDSGNGQIIGSSTSSSASVNFPDGPASVVLKVEVSDGNGSTDSRTITLTTLHQSSATLPSQAVTRWPAWPATQ